MRTAKKLSELLTQKNRSQKEVAEAVEVTPSAINQVLKNKTTITIELLEKISKYLKLSKDEELELWKAWSLDRAEPKAAAYFEKLDKENKKLKKILSAIKEL